MRTGKTNVIIYCFTQNLASVGDNVILRLLPKNRKF